jgi:hypothetical protein
MSFSPTPASSAPFGVFSPWDWTTFLSTTLSAIVAGAIVAVLVGLYLNARQQRRESETRAKQQAKETDSRQRAALTKWWIAEPEINAAMQYPWKNEHAQDLTKFIAPMIETARKAREHQVEILIHDAPEEDSLTRSYFLVMAVPALERVTKDLKDLLPAATRRAGVVTGGESGLIAWMSVVIAGIEDPATYMGIKPNRIGDIAAYKQIAARILSDPLIQPKVQEFKDHYLSARIPYDALGEVLAKVADLIKVRPQPPVP